MMRFSSFIALSEEISFDTYPRKIFKLNMFPLKRFNYVFPVLFVVLVLTTIFTKPCDGQVTFSRDWNAGKRTLDSPDCRSNIKATTAICHMLVNEIRQLAGCEARNEDESSNTGTIFTGKR